MVGWEAATEANEGVGGLGGEEAWEEVEVFWGFDIHLLVERVGDIFATVWFHAAPGTVGGDVTKKVVGTVGGGDRRGAGNICDEGEE